MQLQEACTGRYLPQGDTVNIFGEEVTKYIASVEARRRKGGKLPPAFDTGYDAPFWGARLIWTTLRSQPKAEVRENMRICLEVTQQYPQWIGGYDLVGFEDGGRSLQDHLPDLLWLQDEAKRRGLDLPFFLHAGETLGDGTHADQNLLDALLLGCKRLGHGFALYKHPVLMRMAKRQGVCLEICPISNEILRLTGPSVLTHPLPAYLAAGLQVGIGNDDPGVLGHGCTGAVSHDWWQVGMAFGGVGGAGLGKLAETSVRFAGFWEGKEGGVGEMGGMVGWRGEMVREWEREWERWVRWVVGEFGVWEGVGGGGSSRGS